MTPQELYPVIQRALSKSRELWHGSAEAPAVRQITYDLAAALGVADPELDHGAFVLACGYEWPVEREP